VHLGGCTLRGLWQALEQWMRHVLDQVTLEQLLHNDISVVQAMRAQLPRAEAPRLTLAPLSRGK
jgi:DNA-binding IscR family transcriptional regulator